MNHCKTCKWWDGSQLYSTFGQYYKCVQEDAEGCPIYATHLRLIYTKADFGCVLHEEKNET
jgi:hypothetical protein